MMLHRKAFLALGLLTWAAVSHAAPITLNGDRFSVTYDDIQTGLYKQGLMSGSLDTVYFQPNTFFAFSAASQVSTQASLQLSLTINPGYTFTGLTFTERGDYFLLGGGAANVTAGVQVVNAQTQDWSILNLASGSSLNQMGGSTPWELTGSVSSLGLGSPQTLLITLDNTLFASATGAGLGYIQKTYAGFRVTTAAVPDEPTTVAEPASLSLLAAGVMAAFLVGRTRRLGAYTRSMQG